MWNEKKFASFTYSTINFLTAPNAAFRPAQQAARNLMLVARNKLRVARNTQLDAGERVVSRRNQICLIFGSVDVRRLDAC